MKTEKKEKKKDGKKCSSRACRAASASPQPKTTVDHDSSAPHEPKEEANANADCSLYRQMNLSVSRIKNGIQTDIRVHRETGKPTDIYVSQGDDAWTLAPDELDQLPKALEEEVKTLLTPENRDAGYSWLKFGAEAKKEKKKLRS